MYPIKQSTALDIVFFAFDSNGDGVTGKVDGDWTKRISKNGAAFAAMTVTVTERENGFYHAQISTAHSDTLGVLTASFSASGVKRVNIQFRVHARLPDDLSTQTSVDTVATYVDTEVAAIKAKTDNLPVDPADASDIAASFATVNSTLSTIAGYIDTEVAAIKAKTDNLPVDPADASDIAASFSTVNATLATIAGYIDTEVAAIKAKTDNLPADPAGISNIPTVSQIWTTALTEAYKAAGATGTAAQLLYEILANLTDFSISGTIKTARKLDGSTAKTYTLDSSTAPTSITETT
jgi:heme-degrading monooxygenase HmoA